MGEGAAAVPGEGKDNLELGEGDGGLWVGGVGWGGVGWGGVGGWGGLEKRVE